MEVKHLFGCGEQDSGEPFVVDQPYEWPDDAGSYEYDTDDDPAIEYNFTIPMIDMENTVLVERTKKGSYTVIIAVTDISDGDGDKAQMAFVLYDEDEQLHGQIRTYTLDHDTDDVSATIKIESDVYGMFLDAHGQALIDSDISAGTVESLGDRFAEHRSERDE